MQITQSAFERQPRAFAAALIALMSLSLLNRAPLLADDAPDGDYDGFEDVAKDDNGKPIFAKDESGKGLLEKQCGTKITNICNAGKFASPDEERFFSEFMDTKIGELTWKDNLTKLPDLRAKFRKYFPVAAALPEVHDKLNKMVLEKCKKIVADERFPRAVRVNGMLMIGELNQQEKRSGDLRSVVTLPEARTYLVDSVDQPKLHDALRVAAMDGLERHAATNPTADARKSLKDKMLQLLSKKDSAAGKSRTGQDWVRVKAADILGTLAKEHDEARQADVAMALLDMAAEADLPLWMRCQAVGNMRKLNKNFPADKILPAARQLAGLVVEISASADQLPGAAPKKADAKPAADAAAAGGASKKVEKSEAGKKTADKKKKPDPKKSDQNDDDENAVPAAPAVHVSAKVRKLIGEELVFCLSRVKEALTGSFKKDGVDGLLAAANDPNVRKSIEELVAGVDEMLKIAMDGKREYSVLLADLEKERTELEQWLKTAGVPKPGGGKVGLDKGKSSPPVGRVKTNADVKATVGGK
ncbi:MAG TPA: hypothetical protein VND64_27265 [Pirellulales bacterium]|nr:hypothetical protein [Pirellulales bacterium]